MTAPLPLCRDRKGEARSGCRAEVSEKGGGYHSFFRKAGGKHGKQLPDPSPSASLPIFRPSCRTVLTGAEFWGMIVLSEAPILIPHKDIAEWFCVILKVRLTFRTV